MGSIIHVRNTFLNVSVEDDEARVSRRSFFSEPPTRACSPAPARSSGLDLEQATINSLDTLLVSSMKQDFPTRKQTPAMVSTLKPILSSGSLSTMASADDWDSDASAEDEPPQAQLVEQCLDQTLSMWHRMHVRNTFLEL